jgi:ubiquinone/menaquinone biosynthesis C-methylase UbiE
MSKHKHVETEYAKHANYYDERWARYNHASCSATLNALGQYTKHAKHSKPLSMLDIACGTGLLLSQLHALQPAGNLFGIDLSEPMLMKARQRLGPDVDLQQAKAEQLPFADGQFDVALCNSAAQYFTDLPVFFSEAWRVLRPGGELILTVWAKDTTLASLHYRWLGWRHPAIHDVLTSSAYARQLAAAGFTVADAHRYSAGPLWQLATLRARKPTTTD